jgi:hypothetical protein
MSKRDEKIRMALEIALHDLTFFHGLVVCDSAVPVETFDIDTNAITQRIEEVIREFFDTDTPFYLECSG